MFIAPKKPCDIHNWAQYCEFPGCINDIFIGKNGRLAVKVAFDVITEMTMSRSIGFMKEGGDVDGVLKTLQKDLDYRDIVS